MASDDSDFPLPGPNVASAEEEIIERADTRKMSNSELTARR